MKAIALALLMFCGLARGDEIVVHLGSYHTSRSYETEVTGEFKRYNNVNPGIGYRWKNGWALGTYWNSYKKQTVYVSKEIMFTERFGMELGVGTGYWMVAGRNVMPVGAFVYKIPLDKEYHVDVLFLPPLGSQLSGVAHLTIARKF
jgi:hypothetical protein